jgi:hypothetical protein
MADDRMKKDEQRNMGQGGGEGQNWGQGQGGQQTPGRNPKGDQQSGGQFGHQQGQKDNLNMDDEDEFGGGSTGQRGGQGGGQGRGGQNR